MLNPEIKWIKPSENFIPDRDKPVPGGSSIERQFFKERLTNKYWLGKASLISIDETQYRHALASNHNMSRYQEELLEILGSELYKFLTIAVPEFALSFLPLSENAKNLVNSHTGQALFILSHFLENFRTVGKDFIENYRRQTRENQAGPYLLAINEREQIPLRGLGAMLAAACFLFDPDCIGNEGGNVGYMICATEKGEHYAQIVKIDPGNALSFYKNRWPNQHDPLHRNIVIGPLLDPLGFAELNLADQNEFIVMARHILNLSRPQFLNVCKPAFSDGQWMSSRDLNNLINPLIARKQFFLGAFNDEIDERLVQEIEQAQASLAKEISQTTLSRSEVEQKIQRDDAQYKEANQLRAQLAVYYCSTVELTLDKNMATFQLPTQHAHFNARNSLIDSITNQLNQQHANHPCQIISGLGGMGKSQLAVHYAKISENLKRYSHIIWVHAESYIDGQFQALAEAWLKIANLEAHEAVAAIYRYLKNKKVLIIFDNSADALSLKRYLPPQNYRGQLHLLITTRNSNWGDIPTLSMHGFTEAEAKQFVEKHLGFKQPEELKSLYHLFDGLPLLYLQAITYIKQTNATIPEFIQYFYLNQADLVGRGLISPDSQTKSLNNTITLCLARASLVSADAIKLLQIASYLSPEIIPIDLIINATGFTAASIGNALQALERYSLVTIDRTKQQLQIHRVIQEIIRQKYYHEQLNIFKKLSTVLQSYLKTQTKNLYEDRQYKLYFPHAKFVIENWESRTLVTSNSIATEYVDLLEAIGAYLLTTNIHSKIAIHYFEKALKARKDRNEDNDMAIATLYKNIGIAFGLLGDANKQKEHLEKAYAILEDKYNKSHNIKYYIEMALVSASLASAYGTLGDIRLKKLLLEQSLEILEKHDRTNFHEIAAICSNLGSALGIMGQIKNKIIMLEKAISLKLKQFEINHIEIARTQINLGNAYIDDGNLQKGNIILEQAMHTIKQHYGDEFKNSREAFTALIALGMSYGKLENHEKQIILQEEALSLGEVLLGENHLQIGKLLGVLANSYIKKSELQRSKELFERAHRILILHLGEEHIEVGNVKSDLSEVYRIFGDKVTQKTLLDSALIIFEKNSDIASRQLAITLSNLSKYYGEQNQTDKQLSLLERALTINIKLYGLGHRRLIFDYFMLANAYFNDGQFVKALSNAQSAYEISLKVHGKIHDTTCDCEELFTKCRYYLKQQKSSAASISNSSIWHNKLDNSRHFSVIEEKRSEKCLIM